MNAFKTSPSFRIAGGCRAAAALALLVLLATGCGSLPSKPQRTTLYDFGPSLAAPASAMTTTTTTTSASSMPAAAPQQLIALAEIDSNSRLDSTQMLYRLGYADANELRPYGQSRWSLPPAQLLRQRLRDVLAESHTVLDPGESATIARAEGKVPDTLRISLDEFSQYFESPGHSVGLVRLRATLIRNTPGGDRVLGQKTLTVQRPAPSADAPGGVKALAAASDAAVAELVEWMK
jgi:cholesterol transport system auxiliary component